MKTAFPVLWLLSRPAPGSKAVTALPVTAFALVTALLLTVLAGALSFFTHAPVNDEYGAAGAYQNLAMIALALLVLPLLTLGGSAARLSARRRDERLSTLRLLGATPALARALTVLESTLIAAVGILAGTVLYAAAIPAVALIHFRGKALGMGALWLHPGVVLAAGGLLLLLAAISAAVGLRQVVLSPLGVRTRQKAPTVHWVRTAVGAGAGVVLFLVMGALTSSGSVAVMVVLLVGVFAAGLAVLNLVGPFVLRWTAVQAARTAATPARLLAARTILESPKAAWRQVSGLAMTSFVAVVAGTGLSLVNGAGDGSNAFEVNLYVDMRTGLLITVVASFLLVACSAGVNAAAAVLDRRELYVSLDRLGMPRRVMDAARKRSVMSPVCLVTVGSAVFSAALLFPLTGMALILAPLSLLVIAGVLAGGIALVWLALGATTPVLARVLADA
ncbi:MAG: permease [Specibacter sp.]